MVVVICNIALTAFCIITAIQENSAVGTFITALTAVDEDKAGSDHSIVKYAIEDVTTRFTIEKLSGKMLYSFP